MLTHSELLNSFKKGFRNGNWRKLNRVERGLYRASIIYARFQGKVVNQTLVEQLSYLVERLTETPGKRILKKGYEIAEAKLKICEETGVFEWAPKLRKWLTNKDYITWIGVTN